MAIQEIFSNQELLTYLQASNYAPMPGEALFPEEKQNDLEVKYIKGADGMPVSASVHAYDTESEIASRQSAQEVSLKVALIKRKIGVNEQLLLQLNSLKENSPTYQNIINRMFNDVDNMVQAVRIRIERMRYEVLSTGKITLNENGVKYTIDYHLDDATQKETVVNKWDKDSDPISDIYKWTDAMVTRTGVLPERALIGRRVLAALAQNAKLQKEILGNNARRLSLGEINTFLTSQDLPTLGIESRMYRVENETGKVETHRLFPDNKIVLLPSGPVGRTVYAPTPEEIRLAQDPSIDLSTVGNIIAMVYEEMVDPVATYTKAVASCLPSFEQADHVFIGEVLDPGVG